MLKEDRVWLRIRTDSEVDGWYWMGDEDTLGGDDQCLRVRTEARIN